MDISMENQHVQDQPSSVENVTVGGRMREYLPAPGSRSRSCPPQGIRGLRLGSGGERDRLVAIREDI